MAGKSCDYLTKCLVSTRLEVSPQKRKGQMPKPKLYAEIEKVNGYITNAHPQNISLKNFFES